MRPIRGILELEVSLGLEFLSLGALPPVPIPRVNLAGRRVMIIVKTRRLRPLSLGIILKERKNFFYTLSFYLNSQLRMSLVFYWKSKMPLILKVRGTLEEEKKLNWKVWPTLDYRMKTLEKSKQPSVAAKEPWLWNERVNVLYMKLLK